MLSVLNVHTHTQTHTYSRAAFFCMEMEQQQTLYVAWGSIESPSLDVLGRNLTEQAI
jgi:hypothetical protein